MGRNRPGLVSGYQNWTRPLLRDRCLVHDFPVTFYRLRQQRIHLVRMVMTSGSSKPKSRKLMLLCSVPKCVTCSIRDSCTSIAGAWPCWYRSLAVSNCRRRSKLSVTISFELRSRWRRPPRENLCPLGSVPSFPGRLRRHPQATLYASRFARQNSYNHLSSRVSKCSVAPPLRHRHIEKFSYSFCQRISGKGLLEK
jgi:hypothetical protein